MWAETTRVGSLQTLKEGNLSGWDLCLCAFSLRLLTRPPTMEWLELKENTRFFLAGGIRGKFRAARMTRNWFLDMSERRKPLEGRPLYQLLSDPWPLSCTCTGEISRNQAERCSWETEQATQEFQQQPPEERQNLELKSH